MKKTLLIIILLLTTACQDYVEINDFAIISGIILDYNKDNKFEMISELMINEKETKIEIFKTTGSTIDECLSEISKQSNKDIFISHLKVLLLTENIIKDNIDIYDYFLRSSKSKMNFNIYLIDSKIKDEIFKLYNKESSSTYIEKMMTYNDKIYSSSTSLKFIDLVYKKLEPGLEPIYPNLIITEDEKQKRIELNNLSFFTNNKEKINLSTEESIYYNMLINNIEKTILNLTCEDKEYSLLTKDIKTTKKWNKNTKEFTFNIDIKSNINSYKCKYNLEKEENIKKLNKLSSKEIQNKVNELINIQITNNYDFLGIQNYIYKHDKKRNLNNIKIKTNVNVEINSIGEIRR